MTSRSEIKLVYIAAPYSDDDPWKVEQNVRRAEKAAHAVMQIDGLWPVCPHANTRGYFLRSCSPEQAYAGTAAMLTRCDAALFLHGWRTSAGARGERKLCEEEDVPFFDELVDLTLWSREVAGV